MSNTMEPGQSQASLLAVLQNELVMEHLSGYLSTGDLGKCRLVSKSWNEWLTPVFRKTAVVTGIGKFLKWKLENPNCENFELHPFKKFHINFNQCFGEDANPFGDAILPMKLLESCALVMTYLKISGAVPPEFSEGVNFEVDDEIPQDLDFPRLRTFILDGEGMVETCKCTTWILRRLIRDGTGAARTTHLTSLEVNSSSFSDGATGRRDEVSGLLHQLFLQSPALKVFRVRNFGRRPVGGSSFSELESHLKVLHEIRKEDARKFNIKVLDVLMMNKEPEAQMPQLQFAVTLRDLQFPLETLTLDLGSVTNGSNLFELLDPFKGTLKKLVLYRGTGAFDVLINSYKDCPFGMEFPSLRTFRNIGITFRNLNYLKFMPKLTQLEICSGLDKERFYEGSIVPKRWDNESLPVSLVILRTDEELIGGMEALLEFRLDFICPSAAIEMLARLMPNLQRLNIAVLHDDDKSNMDLLETIENNFGNLSQLTLQMQLNSGNSCVRNFRKLKNLEKIVLSPVVAMMKYDVTAFIQQEVLRWQRVDEGDTSDDSEDELDDGNDPEYYAQDDGNDSEN